MLDSVSFTFLYFSLLCNSPAVIEWFWEGDGVG